MEPTRRLESYHDIFRLSTVLRYYRDSQRQQLLPPPATCLILGDHVHPIMVMPVPEGHWWVALPGDT
jgi:hypothetical protein